MRFEEECVCLEYEDIVLEENRSRISFLNPQNERIEKVLIDDCVIKDIKRCDWLLMRNDGLEIFIELKGVRNFKNAFNQIENSILKTSSAPTTTLKYAYIVLSLSYIKPRFLTEMVIQRKDFMTRYMTELKLVQTDTTVDILSL